MPLFEKETSSLAGTQNVRFYGMIGSGVQNLEEKSQREVDDLFGFLSES